MAKIFQKIKNYLSPRIDPLEFEGSDPALELELGPHIQEEELAADQIGQAVPRGPIDDRPSISSLPEGRVSYSPEANTLNFNGIVGELGNTYRIVTPQFIRQVIPIIRALTALNPDASQALDNVVSLANSGHKVFFDRNVSQDQVDQMRNHLENKRSEWAPGLAGIDGLVNRFFSQIMISGALSSEWAPNIGLTGIEACLLLDPETIVFKLNNRQTKYEPYQRVTNALLINTNKSDTINGLIKLNTNTYKYYALTGDGEFPYAIPPYLPIMPRVRTQNKMNENIDFIVDTMGLIGFLQVLIQKPQFQGRVGPLNNEAKYQAELDRILLTAKDKIIGGLKDGVVVGFKDDHEFEFNSASKNYEAVNTLYQENELQMASAMKQDASLWGRGYSTSETQINVVFMKMLSQLKNIQNLVSRNLEFGYALELRLAGFKFDYLKVKFNRSTLQDDLKFQQAEEYKIKNVQSKYVLGLIDQDMMADELGYEVSAEGEPRVPVEMLAGAKTIPTNADGSPAANPRSSQKKKAAKKTKSKSKPVTKD